MKAFLTLGVLSGMVDVADAKPEMLIPLPMRVSTVIQTVNPEAPKQQALEFFHIGNTKIHGEEIAIYEFKGLKE